MNVLVTSNDLVAGTAVYKLPNNIRYSAVQLKSAYINNNWDNVTGHLWTLKKGTGYTRDIQVPAGRYNPQSYSNYLMQNLNLNKPPNSSFVVGYNDSTQKFSLRVQNSSGETIKVTPNQKALDFSGIPETEFTTSTDMEINSTNSKSKISPAYFTIRSNSLRNSGFFTSTGLSNVVGIVPVSDGLVSSWSETTSFHPANSNIENQLYNEMHLEICLEDNVEAIIEPIFALLFEFV